MAPKATTKSEIETKSATSACDIWRIGLTHDLAERKKYWKEIEGQNPPSGQLVTCTGIGYIPLGTEAGGAAWKSG